jgi:hypothetical protein
VAKSSGGKDGKRHTSLSLSTPDGFGKINKLTGIRPLSRKPSEDNISVSGEKNGKNENHEERYPKDFEAGAAGNQLGQNPSAPHNKHHLTRHYRYKGVNSQIGVFRTIFVGDTSKDVKVWGTGR